MRKSPIDMDLAERKSVLIQSCFVDVADMDYLTARWAYKNGIFHNFCWSAAQSVEKYIKAALLYNNRSTLGFGHNLHDLTAAMEKIEPGAFSRKIVMPRTTGLGREMWDQEPFSKFMDWLREYCSTDVRYSLNDTKINGPMIHILDQLCSLLRAFIRNRNFFGEDLFALSQADVFESERIRQPCTWMIDLELILEGLFRCQYRVGHDEALRNTFRNMNFAFFNERDANESTFGGEVYVGSPMWNHLVRLRAIDPSAENLAIIDQLKAWARSNIQLGGVQVLLDRNKKSLS